MFCREEPKGAVAFLTQDTGYCELQQLTVLEARRVVSMLKKWLGREAIAKRGN